LFVAGIIRYAVVAKIVLSMDRITLTLDSDSNDMATKRLDNIINKKKNRGNIFLRKMLLDSPGRLEKTTGATILVWKTIAPIDMPVVK
tara:strand:+ start:155 stop:418 length:264 start_codon:yes stop_codon:yes gene_type:complete